MQETHASIVCVVAIAVRNRTSNVAVRKRNKTFSLFVYTIRSKIYNCSRRFLPEALKGIACKLKQKLNGHIPFLEYRNNARIFL